MISLSIFPYSHVARNKCLLTILRATCKLEIFALVDVESIGSLLLIGTTFWEKKRPPLNLYQEIVLLMYFDCAVPENNKK